MYYNYIIQLYTEKIKTFLRLFFKKIAYQVKEIKFMAKERVLISIADLKMTLLTADPDAVRKMAASIDARITRISKGAKCPKNNALAMLIME